MSILTDPFKTEVTTIISLLICNLNTTEKEKSKIPNEKEKNKLSIFGNKMCQHEVNTEKGQKPDSRAFSPSSFFYSSKKYKYLI